LILHAKYGIPTFSVKPNRGRVDAANQVQQAKEKGTGYVFVLSMEFHLSIRNLFLN